MEASETSPLEATESPDARALLRDIQGNIVGFNKDHQLFVFLQFPDTDRAKAFLAEIESDIASGLEVKRFNALFKEIHGRRQAEPGIIQACWTNLVLSHSGLQVLGAAGVEDFPGEFTEGMAARADAIGDKDGSAPGTWMAPFSDPASVHAMAIIAADERSDLDAGHARLSQMASNHGVAELLIIDGHAREGDARGHEHFGFKDGISQPGIAAITSPSKTGQDEIAPGEFLIGHPDETGHVSGQPEDAPPQDPSGYTPEPPEPNPMPDWAKNGSFAVFRRLRQDVQGFDDFLAQHTADTGLSADQLGAKFVGRWKSGAPLERTRDQDASVDPTVEDPSIADPSLLGDRKINNFDYDQDADGTLVPRAAHIRKTNPRSQEPPGKAETNRHRILRRGIPYGPEFQPGEAAYGEVVPDTQDRGLLFLCYQASISRGFEFIQAAWANGPDFPQAGDGRDPIISQDVADPQFRLREDLHLTTARWVITTGGGYFFAPSISGIRTLAGIDQPVA